MHFVWQVHAKMQKESIMANVAYLRCSSDDQNLDRQIEAMKNYKIDKFFSEKISGKDMNRPQLNAMLEYIREGDIVYILDFSRLARSTVDLLNLVTLFQEKRVQLVSIKENVDTSTATGRLMLQMIAAINEFERANLLERQREGVRLAKAQGKYKGRQKAKVDMKRFEELYELWTKHKTNKSKMAEELKVSRTVIDRLLNEKNNGS